MLSGETTTNFIVFGLTWGSNPSSTALEVNHYTTDAVWYKDATWIGVFVDIYIATQKRGLNG